MIAPALAAPDADGGRAGEPREDPLESCGGHETGERNGRPGRHDDGEQHERPLPDGPLNVCVLVPYDLAEDGGVKSHAVHLAARLRERGDEVTIAGPLSSGAAEPGVRGFGGVVNVPANGAANKVALLTPPWAVSRFFRERSFDVVHFHEPLVPPLAYYARWLSPRTARVATFHMYAEDEGVARRLLRRGFSRTVFPGVDRAIAVSRPAQAFARAAWTGPLTVIPNGVSTALFHPPAGPDPARDGSDERAPARLLFVGSWRDERKGLRYLVEAHRILRREGLAVVLDVIGSGPAGQVPRREPALTFHGRVTSEAAVAEAYRACDVFVAPATGQESFGIVLLEAMASGRAVVCSDIAGYREVATEDGARLAPASDPAALARAIAGVVRDPAARGAMGRANRRRAEEFEWAVVAARIREEYVEALRARAGHNGHGRPGAEAP